MKSKNIIPIILAAGRGSGNHIDFGCSDFLRDLRLRNFHPVVHH